MGRKSSQKKNVAMLDSDDTDSLSSSSTIRSDNVVVSGFEEVQIDTESLLDQCLDALYEKRGSTREKALASIIEAFNSSLQHEFILKKFATLLHQCLNSIKKGSPREVALASHVIGLLALTTGPGHQAEEILEESVTPIMEALKTRQEASKISSLLECLAIITFVGGEAPEYTERSMQIMWQMAHPKLGPNVAAAKPSPPMITMVISAWSFLLTSMDPGALSPKSWQESMSYLSTLLDKDDRALRIAAGEALALIFEIDCLEKFCGETKASGTTIHEANESRTSMYINGLRNKVLNQVRGLSIEAGGKGSAKKDLNNQRSTFRDILDYIEGGYAPEASVKIGGESLNVNTWVQLIQLSFLKHFLGGGFVKHMQENEFLHDVFGFTPKKKVISGVDHHISAAEKKMYKSPNSALNKARTQFLNKQRMLSQQKNAGQFAVGFANDY